MRSTDWPECLMMLRQREINRFFSQVFDHFKTLPDIEQAHYPGDYEAKLQTWIDLDYN